MLKREYNLNHAGKCYYYLDKVWINSLRHFLSIWITSACRNPNAIMPYRVTGGSICKSTLLQHIIFFSKSRLGVTSIRKMATPSNSSSVTGQSKDDLEETVITPSKETCSTRGKFSSTKEELKARLSPIQYQVTQLKSTERPGSGVYNKFNEKGSYHCVVCDEELFKSETKFDSGCGWPAFFDAIDKSRLKFVRDYALVGASNLLLLAKNPDLIRTEVLCCNCNAHLGHRFDDGPISKGGKRYCINSAALRFEASQNSQGSS